MKEIIISSQSSKGLINISELWNNRELLYIFSWRDVKVRYKQTILGVLWVIFQPLVSTLIFTFFFGRLVKIPSYDLPYSLFVLSGLVFWTFFVNSVSHASGSLVANEGIIKKVYFPRLLLPLSSVITGFVDFVINLMFLFIIALILGYAPNVTGLVVFPMAVLITVMTAAGLGFLFSSINVKYRDINVALPFFMQMLLFLSPIIYPLAIVSDRNKIIMALNPMTAVVESVRMVFSGRSFINLEIVVISLVSSVFILMFGLWYFQRTESFFADIV